MNWIGDNRLLGLRSTKTLLAILFLGCGILPVDTEAQTKDLERFVYRQGHMGMEVRMVLYASDRGKSEGAARAAFEKVATLDSLLSSYRSDSELTQVNQQASQEPVSVGYHLFTVLERAQEFARRSEGALDVTAGPFIELWRDTRRTKQLPDSTTLREVSRRVGWQHLHLDDRTQEVSFVRDGMELNLGGLAKGYILDQALEVLIENGVSRALVEAGGDLVVGASPPGRSGWTVDIPHRVSEDTSTTLTVAHSAVATSGDAVQYVEIEGQRYSHVINPQTGLGLTDHPTTTVVAPSGIVADGLATTIGILGVQDGETFVGSYYPCPDVYASTSDSTYILQNHAISGYERSGR